MCNVYAYREKTVLADGDIILLKKKRDGGGVRAQ